jgi:hypothetical protein
VRTGRDRSAIHAFGDLNFAIALPRTESMRAIALPRYGHNQVWPARTMENQTVRASPKESARPGHDAVQPMT